MTKFKTKNVAASVSEKLRTRAKERGDDFQLVLLRYVNERFLFRLANSRHSKNFVLKGATLFTVWTGHPHRASRDLDFLGKGDSSEAHLGKVFTEVLQQVVDDDDGVLFASSSLKTSPIREQEEYGGVRLTFTALVGKAELSMQIDVGFGDAITPAAVEIDFPAMLDFPAPRLRAYPRETVVAEKVEAMVKLGLANTRMKDFYDLKTMAERFEFDGQLLVKAIRATFKRRETALPTETPEALTKAFFGDQSRKRQWTAFAKKSGASDAGDLEQAMASVARFCEMPLNRASSDGEWSAVWKPGGPWSG